MAAGDGNRDVRAEYFDGKSFCCSGVECTAQAAVGRVLEQCDNEPRNVVQQGALQRRMMWCSDRCALQGTESELRAICLVSDSKLCGHSTRTQQQQAILGQQLNCGASAGYVQVRGPRHMEEPLLKIHGWCMMGISQLAGDRFEILQLVL